MYNVKKKRLVWVFQNGREQGDDNETGLKEGKGTEMSTTVLPQMHALLRFVFEHLRKW